ncbi:MAG: GtrA family protein [Rhodobacterales bacterium]|nr:GtrA family protein [Rhodobacterales bacterium]
MRKIKELLRFGSVGLLATATHALTYLALLAVTVPHIANLLGFCLALVFSYWGHSRFTFTNHKADTWEERRRRLSFLAVALLGLALNTGFVHLTTLVLRLPDWSPVILIACVTPALTYILLKLWVFRPRSIVR